jgi:hypothetical protein
MVVSESRKSVRILMVQMVSKFLVRGSACSVCVKYSLETMLGYLNIPKLKIFLNICQILLLSSATGFKLHFNRLDLGCPFHFAN